MAADPCRKQKIDDNIECYYITNGISLSSKGISKATPTSHAFPNKKTTQYPDEILPKPEKGYFK